MDHVRQTLNRAVNFTIPDIPAWARQIRQDRLSRDEEDTASRRGSNASSNSDVDVAHREWERERAMCLLEGRMSFDDERRAVWRENPEYPFAPKGGSTVGSSYATVNTSSHTSSAVPIVDKLLGWTSHSLSSQLRPPHTKMRSPDSKPDAWLNSSPSLPPKSASVRLRSSSTDSEWTLAPSELAYRPSWLASKPSEPCGVHRTDAPPITRLYAGPGAQVRDHIAMGGTRIEFVPKSAAVQVQRPVEAYCSPGQKGSLEESGNSVEVLFGNSDEKLRQIPCGIMAMRQRELELERRGSGSVEPGDSISCHGGEAMSAAGRARNGPVVRPPEPVLLKGLRWTEYSYFGNGDRETAMQKDGDVEKAAFKSGQIERGGDGPTPIYYQNDYPPDQPIKFNLLARFNLDSIEMVNSQIPNFK
ncbi:hypothetical protein CLAFUW4_04389 [Fulvia fulva]|uniref:uncharacterized protein n=1 Tax=Passalora fulva TaxID=5499 RepID=UPI00285295A0|nr:uncharacterized protein CLAFUR5_20179 [Fulvia fulva]KAK4626581.1 hypothetical protein CLAFUR4_04375 [Fulvia fulva]KAK4627874.1 hypothetical protein CLAFUR0_04377 [Fulvia fulva]WMI38860.1 hypothetical protein CLAFUR5_20179 [Fulvia fulva]WPV13949.1 hypothetical protein CLAFUW4_04389 [Fulvia fulva]WPV28427.1 hypothetical protein CLAFUW7_04379 [Fulvia fulva]